MMMELMMKELLIMIIKLQLLKITLLFTIKIDTPTILNCTFHILYFSRIAYCVSNKHMQSNFDVVSL
jgi:hypothetical protein